MRHTGKRAAPRKKASLSPALLGLCVGVTLCVVAWGYLVRAAIDFGATARTGRSDAWWFLGLASLGAVACLFVGLILLARITRRLGITGPAPATEREPRPEPQAAPEPGPVPVPAVVPVDLRRPSRPVGHRAAR